MNYPADPGVTLAGQLETGAVAIVSPQIGIIPDR